MALTGHITTVQEPGEPAPIPHAEPQQQGPNTPGKHWKAKWPWTRWAGGEQS